MPHKCFGLDRVCAANNERLQGTKPRRNRMLEGQKDGEGASGRITRLKNEPDD